MAPIESAAVQTQPSIKCEHANAKAPKEGVNRGLAEAFVDGVENVTVSCTLHTEIIQHFKRFLWTN
jgi:hypothetical protein